jgi:hypothetical protein
VNPPAALPSDPAPAAPPLLLDQRSEPAPQPARAEPFYRKFWFLGVVGVVLTTTAIIVVASVSSDPLAPTTTLGDKHAF